MFDFASGSTPCQAGVAGSVHTQGAATKAKGKPLGYSFDPIPRSVEDSIRARKLKPIDERVILQLLRFPRNFRASCWTTKGTIAAALGCDEKTVQRSFERLERAGLIVRREVSRPDPDEPINRTGWRIYFPFIATPPEQGGSGVDRRPPMARRKWALIDALTLPMGPPVSSPQRTEMSSPGRTPVSSPQRTEMSSKECAGASNQVLDGPELDGETPPSSSSPEKSDDDDSFRTLSKEEQEKPLVGTTAAAAVEVAREVLGQVVAQQLADDVARVEARIGGEQPWERFIPALYLVALRIAAARSGRGRPVGDPISYAITTARSFAACGVSIEARDAEERHRQRVAAATAPPPPPPPVATPPPVEESPPSEADIEQARAWADSSNRGLAPMGRAILVAAGLACALPPRAPGQPSKRR